MGKKSARMAKSGHQWNGQWADGESRAARASQGEEERERGKGEGTGRGRWNGRESIRLDWICDAGWPLLDTDTPSHVPSPVLGPLASRTRRL